MRITSAVICIVLGTSVPVAAVGQVSGGLEAGYLGGVGVGVGGQVKSPLAPLIGASEGFLAELEVAGIFDYYFMSDEDGRFAGVPVTASYSYMEFIGRATYPFEVEATIAPYVGAGLSLTRFGRDLTSQQFGGSSDEHSESEFGIQVVGGVKFDEASIPFYIELRASSTRLDRGFGDETSGLSLIAGILLGGGQ